MHNPEILNLIDNKILLCNELIEKLQNYFNDIDGVQRTRRNIEKERKFLKKVKLSKFNFTIFLIEFFFFS
jgi:hypothetical protein